MTRPKVDPEKRQRTANACDSCKRRKQKCDGQKPCSTCDKKHFTCEYNTTDHNQNGHSPSDHYSKKRIRSNGGLPCEASSPAGKYFSESVLGPNPHRPGGDTPSIGDGARPTLFFQPRPDVRPDSKVHSDHASTSGGDEEVDNHTMTRMLEDGAGRLIYVGDAATLSFLQLLRMIVETAVGPTPFSMDPARHTITESKLTLSPNSQITHVLPEKRTALILVDSFFVNTHGLIEAFDEKTFLATLDRCYSDPLTIDHVYLCHLNLILAIGLAFATPEVETPEAKIIDALRLKYPDQSEVFYINARGLNNPTIGFEDGDLWSIQALLLMALYMLTRAKTNTAFSYIGMAVRTSYALGLHREETLVFFPAEEQASRKRIWRSLFIMDRFLATFLGRPVAIAEEECSGEILNPVGNPFANSTHLAPARVGAAGLDAAVRSCHVIGLILRKVYLQRRISTRLAQELADICKLWPENLSPALHWRQASSNNRRQAIAILHSNLAYCHSVILLSRPFFLYLLSSEIQRTQLGSDPGAQRRRGRMEKFSDACIIASTHTVALVQNAYEGRYLSKANPFASYSLFAAALILFANEFAHPSANELSNQCMANSIAILSYCGEMDPQAKRSAYILSEFRDVIRRQKHQSAFQLQPPPALQILPALAPTPIMGGQDSFMPPLKRGFIPIPPLPGASLASAPRPPTAPANPANSTSLSRLPLSHQESFSGLLDLNNTVLPTLSDPESSIGDEAIDFDSLWGRWPGSIPTPNYGTPGIGLGQSGNAVPGAGEAFGTSLFEQV